MERGIIVSAIGLTIIGGAWLFSRRLAAEIESVFGPPFAEPFGDIIHVGNMAATRPETGGGGLAATSSGHVGAMSLTHRETGSSA